MELLIDRVIVDHDQVEIQYVVPTGPQGETVPFCHLRLDYHRCFQSITSPSACAVPLEAKYGGEASGRQAEAQAVVEA